MATVDPAGRPRSRVIWAWDGTELVGWVGTSPSPERAHLEHSPYVSCSYWTPSQDDCVAECHAEWVVDDADGSADADADGLELLSWTDPGVLRR